MTKNVEKKIENMCNLSNLIEKQGIQHKIPLGIEQGIKAMILNNLEEGFPAEKL